MRKLTIIDITDPNLDYFAKKQLVTYDADLEDLEVAAVAKQAALEDSILADMTSKFSEVKSEWRDKLERQEHKVEQLRKDIARGKQTRTVRADQIFSNGSIVSFDPKTGNVLHERPAAPGEAQKALPNADGGGLLADAARAQKKSNVEVTDEGDVVPPEDSDEPKKNGKKK